MKYTIVTANSLTKLEDEVEALIDDGWRPVGGLAVVDDLSSLGPDTFAGYYRIRGDTWFYQAMIREGDE